MYTTESKRDFARQLRQRSTDSERKAWEALRDRRFYNLKFRRQHVLEGFVVDFYCHKLRLAIEIDGPIHDKQEAYDETRQGIIETKGITFLRITNNEIDQDVGTLLNKIKEFRSQFNKS
jgi:very-short-patch-repair endonuclease